MKRLTDNELIALYDSGNVKELWREALREVAPIQRRLASNGWDCNDDDTLQNVQLSIGEALCARAWKPELGAFTTWIRDVIEGALRDSAREGGNLGVGSRRQLAEHEPIEIVSLDAEIPGVTDEDGSPVTYLDQLTYEDTGNVPEGFGPPEQEYTQVEKRQTVVSILGELAPQERDTLIALYLNGETQEEVAQREGVGRTAIAERARTALKRAREVSDKLPRTCYRGDTAPLRFTRKVEGQPAQMYYLDANEVVFTDGGPVVQRRKARSFEFDSALAGKGVASVKS